MIFIKNFKISLNGFYRNPYFAIWWLYKFILNYINLSWDWVRAWMPRFKIKAWPQHGGLGFRFLGLGFGMQGLRLGFGVPGFRVRVWKSGFKVRVWPQHGGLGFWFLGLGFGM